ncbi:hypothetical protein H0H81_006566 [Sphagnurus paluster]|uniref:BTB domain-containing protein n=1 Tax=Sphagnurus paluster TaxID=117069 RepID=A0A9P7GQK2_9AGAR|nr:hypothetical protein H0H81_006566 [Sphagnurus paluster]
MPPNMDDISETPAPPFNKKPYDTGGDVILRSSDGEEFHVHRTLLSLASPVFETMFTLPQPEGNGISSDNTHELASVALSEGRKALYQLLLWCDPRGVPSYDLDDIEHVLPSVAKYEMSAVLQCIRVYLVQGKEYVEKEPVRVYAIAIRHGFQDLARIAAKETLHVPLDKRQQCPALYHISGMALYHLYAYFMACRDIVQTLFIPTQDPYADILCPLSPLDVKVDQFSPIYPLHEKREAEFIHNVWLRQKRGSSSCSKCKSISELIHPQSDKVIYNAEWRLEYLRAVMSELKNIPRGRTVSNMTGIIPHLTKAVGCPECRATAGGQIFLFNKIFAHWVDKKIDEVCTF